MSLKALSYLGIRSDKLNDWSSFAGGLLGMQKIDKGGKSMAFRMDSQEQRLLVSDEPGETLAFIGWEVGARDDLETRPCETARLLPSSSQTAPKWKRAVRARVNLHPAA